MKTTLAIWLLSGALAASASLHVHRLRSPAPEPPAPAEVACTVDVADLGLSAGEQDELAGACGRSCREAERLEADARGREQELHRLLASSELEPAEARRLAREVGKLRARALVSCVEAVLEVRELLGADRVATLLEGCCATLGSCR